MAGDLSDPLSLRGVCFGVDTVVHAASYVGRDPRRCCDVNLKGTRALLEEAHRSRVRRFGCISTASVYGTGLHRGLAEGHLEPRRPHPRAPRGCAPSGRHTPGVASFCDPTWSAARTIGGSCPTCSDCSTSCPHGPSRRRAARSSRWRTWPVWCQPWPTGRCPWVAARHVASHRAGFLPWLRATVRYLLQLVSEHVAHGLSI
ncbi:NAD-dependent epimerase/dehydratase family protein [Streptomyces sp. bgisy027]|uniref:NAD-dependent epimerase/dehydratase family protein n=1 Tax=Streptomyces sp. bgisy027 TaxID=3413770 RepID=UPI003D72B7D6